MIIPFRSDLELDEKPYATFALIGINVAIYFLVDTLKPEELQMFYQNWGFSAFEFGILRMLTSMFLHGGLMHLIGNMLFLWIYGPGVERALSPVGFVAYYIFFGVAAVLMHWLSLKPYDIDQPLIGASGAISGVMGAFFVIYPTIKIRHCLIIFPRLQFSLPAWLVLGYWFILQWDSASKHDMSSVAFFAHIGGFLAGFVGAVYVKFGGGFKGAFSKVKAHPAIDEAQNLPDDVDPRVGMTAIKEVLDQSPDNPNLKYWYAVMSLRAGRTEAAERMIDGILPCIPEEDVKGRLSGHILRSAFRPVDPHESVMEFGLLLENNGNTRESYELFRDYLARHPDAQRPAQYRYRMGELLNKLDRADEARVIFEELAGGDKRDPLVQAAEFEMKKLTFGR